MQRARSIALLFCLIFSLSLPSAYSYGQDNKLNYGQTVTGEITAQVFRVSYQFQGRVGDIIDIDVAVLQGTLYPQLVLLDGQGNIIALTSSLNEDRRLSLKSVPLSNNAVYNLIMTRFGQERGTTTGTFSLELKRVGVTSNPNTTSTVIIQYGDSMVGRLGGEVYQQIYSFSALRGDIVSVQMQRISGDLDALLILADAVGNVLLTSDDDPNRQGTLDAAINDYRVQHSGNYAIIATRFGREAGASSGGYTLQLERITPEALGETPDQAVLLDVDISLTGTINSATPQRYYLIEGKLGDKITIEVRRTTGNLDPIVELRSADLQRILAKQDSGARGIFARIRLYEFPLDGNYVLVVSRFNGVQGKTQGQYTVTMTRAEQD